MAMSREEYDLSRFVTAHASGIGFDIGSIESMNRSYDYVFEERNAGISS